MLRGLPPLPSRAIMPSLQERRMPREDLGRMMGAGLASSAETEETALAAAAAAKVDLRKARRGEGDMRMLVGLISWRIEGWRGVMGKENDAYGGNRRMRQKTRFCSGQICGVCVDVGKPTF